MSKRNLITFALLTLGLILVSGLYLWKNNMAHVSTIQYISDPQWSKPAPIVEQLRTDQYCAALDSGGKLHLAWINYLPSTANEELVYAIVSPVGRFIMEPKVILQKEEITDLAFTVRDNRVDIFWIGSSNPDEKYLDLFYTRLDFSGKIQEYHTVQQTTFVSPKDFRAVNAPSGDFMLAWSDLHNGYHQVKTMLIDSAGNAKGETVQRTSSSFSSVTPNLVVDSSEQYYLTWKEEQGYFNHYKLYYQVLDHSGQPLSTPTFIDDINHEDGDLPVAMAVADSKVYLAWSKMVHSVEQKTAAEKNIVNYEIYGTIINPEVGQLPIKRLTTKNGISFNPVVTANANGDIHLVYLDSYQDQFGLTHQVYTGNFSQLNKGARRIFAELQTSNHPTVVADSAQGVHMVWVETDKAGYSIQYANTLKPHTPSPFQVVGVTGGSFGSRVWTGILYVLSAPVYMMAIHLGWIALYGLIYWGLIWIAKRFDKDKFINNRYLMPLVLMGIHAAVYFRTTNLSGFFWPTQPALHQLLPIFGLVTTATLAYLFVSKRENGNILQAGAVAVLWVYWLNVVTLTLHLPFLNF